MPLHGRSRRNAVKRIAAALGLLVVCLAASASEAQNYVQNARFMVYREGWPVVVPEGGGWFPEAWRIAPGVGGQVTAILTAPGAFGELPPPVSQQGLELYLRWTAGQFDPYLERGSAFLEHHIFEFDALAGRTLRLTFWARVDGCCVPVVPFIQVQYAAGDFEFYCSDGVSSFPCWFPHDGPPVTVTTQWQLFSLLFALPTGAGHALSGQRYISPQFTFSHPTAPGLHMAHFTLERL